MPKWMGGKKGWGAERTVSIFSNFKCPNTGLALKET
jgi:hypothetical protein